MNLTCAHSPVRATSVPANGLVGPYGSVRAMLGVPDVWVALGCAEGAVKKPVDSVEIGRPHHRWAPPGSGAERASLTSDALDAAAPFGDAASNVRPVLDGAAEARVLRSTNWSVLCR